VATPKISGFFFLFLVLFVFSPWQFIPTGLQLTNGLSRMFLQPSAQNGSISGDEASCSECSGVVLFQVGINAVIAKGGVSKEMRFQNKE
jgi:hypothetical protein